MIDTDQLIEQLASRAPPVRRLASPLWRTLLWLGLTALVLALLVAIRGVHPNAMQMFSDPATALEWIAGLLTGALAAYATFQVSVPGRPARWAWLPVPAAMLWLAGIGWGCLRDIAQMGMTDALAFQANGSECAWAITMASVPLGLVMLLLVRHAGVVRPASTALLAVLSVAALSSSGVSLFHEGETMLMVLLWHAGAVAVLSLLSLAFSRRLFGWLGYARR